MRAAGYSSLSVCVSVYLSVTAQLGSPGDLGIIFRLVALKVRFKIWQILQRSLCFAEKASYTFYVQCSYTYVHVAQSKRGCSSNHKPIIFISHAVWRGMAKLYSSISCS